MAQEREEKEKTEPNEKKTDQRENVFVEGEEEIPAIIAKIKAAKSSEIALVIPRGSGILQSLVNLKLLKKACKQDDKELSLITTDHIGRNLASQVGVLVYDSIHSVRPVLESSRERPKDDEEIHLDQSTPEIPVDSEIKIHHFQGLPAGEKKVQPSDEPAEEKTVNPSRPLTIKGQPRSAEQEEEEEEGFPPHRPERPAKILHYRSRSRFHFPSLTPGRLNWKKILLIFLLLVLAGAVVFLFIPRSVITLVVQGEDYENTLKLEANVAAKTTSLEEMKIPGHLVQAQKETKKTFTASGKKNVGEKARGQVTFSNAWSTDNQTIPAGTVLVKDNKNFLTAADVAVPGATLSLSEGQIVTKAGTIKGVIEAKEPGEDYNVGAGKFEFVSFPAEKKAKFYAESSQSLSGGTSRQLEVVSAEDLDKAKKELRQGLVDAVLAELRDKNPNMTILGEGVEYGVVSEQSSAKEGEEKKQFEFSLTLRGKGVAFEKGTFRDAFLQLVRLELPQDKELYFNEQDEIATTVREQDIEAGRLVLEGSLKTRIAPRLDQSRLKKLVFGKKATEAKDVLEQEPDIEEVKIDISPAWFPYRIPYFAFATKIQIEYK